MNVQGPQQLQCSDTASWWSMRLFISGLWIRAPRQALMLSVIGATVHSLLVWRFIRLLSVISYIHVWYKGKQTTNMDNSTPCQQTTRLPSPCTHAQNAAWSRGVVILGGKLPLLYNIYLHFLISSGKYKNCVNGSTVQNTCVCVCTY